MSREGGARGARRAAILAATSVGVVLAVGCGVSRAPLFVDFAPPNHPYRSVDYPQIYERWTRHEKVLHETDTALEVWATYKSAEFREAFVSHYADAYQLAPSEADRLRQAQRDAATVSYDFVVTSQSNNYRWNDLEKKNSPWRVSLIDGAGHVVTPDELREERFPDIFEQAFYPAKTPFSKTYSIRFTHSVEHDDTFLGERTGSITLRMAGPFGHVDLVWRAQPAP